jgi:hypothetical protein
MFKFLFAILVASQIALSGCKTDENNVHSVESIKRLTGVLVDADNNGKPMSGVFVKLFEQYQPLTSMKSWREIEAIKTDENGVFVFNTRRLGPYQIRWYPHGKKGLNIMHVLALSSEEFIEIKHRDEVETPW